MPDKTMLMRWMRGSMLTPKGFTSNKATFDSSGDLPTETTRNTKHGRGRRTIRSVSMLKWQASAGPDYRQTSSRSASGM